MVKHAVGRQVNSCGGFNDSAGQRLLPVKPTHAAPDEELGRPSASMRGITAFILRGPREPRRLDSYNTTPVEIYDVGRFDGNV